MRKRCTWNAGLIRFHALIPAWTAFLAVLVLSSGLAEPGAAGQPPDAGAAGGSDQDPQVLTRGAVHEAFAAPVPGSPTPGQVIPKEPPAAIEEMPPDQKPSGANVQWIPGYWSWDQGRTDFVWISGVWREPPPGRQWVPGYWHQVDGGFQWVPGAWVPVPQPQGGGAGPASGPATQASYMPAPPASLETGPNSPQPGPGVFWSPGSWYWQENRYVWRPGFWAAVQPNWVWIPPHYVWTPGGYLFVEGYWDLPLANRGLMFAPVYYPQPVYLQPAYVYTPTITIATGGLVANLFVQPGYGHYCFGDYYDRTYIGVGIFPWFSFTYVSGPARSAYYDPIFTFYASVNVSRDPGWITRVRQEYIVRRDNVAMRPPQTYIEQTRIIERNVTMTGRARQSGAELARPIHELARQGEANGGMRMERLSDSARNQWRQRGTELAQFRQERLRQEHAAAVGHTGEGAARGAMGRNAERPRPLALHASPVGAPIHEHAGHGESVGPMGHADHRIAASGAGANGRMSHTDPGGRSASQLRGAQPTEPSLHHPSGEAPAGWGEHHPGLGSAAPHDVGRQGEPSFHPGAGT